MRLLPISICSAIMIANRRDRSFVFMFLMLFCLAGASVARANAAVHPVPLDKNVDAAKCLECHEDKSKGKFVHSAIAMGCLSCHEVRINSDITHVKLITSAVPYKVCLTCHEDKDATKIKGTRAPARGSRLPDLPRSAHFRQQISAAEGDLGR